MPEELGSLEIVWRQSWSDHLLGFLLRLSIVLSATHSQVHMHLIHPHLMTIRLKRMMMTEEKVGEQR